MRLYACPIHGLLTNAAVDFRQGPPFCSVADIEDYEGPCSAIVRFVGLIPEPPDFTFEELPEEQEDP